MQQNRKNERIQGAAATRTEMLARFMQGAKGYFLVGMLFACAGVVAEMVRPKIIQYTVDGILGNDITKIPQRLLELFDGRGGTEYLMNHLWIPALAVVGFSMLGMIFQYIYQMSVVKGGERFIKTMRDSLLEQIQHLPMPWYGQYSTGDLIQRCTADVQTVKLFLSDQLISLVSMILTILFAIGFLLKIDIPLAMIVLVGIPVLLGSSILFHTKISTVFRECDENEGVLSAITQENLSGVRVVRAFGREREEEERFRKQNQVVTDRWIHLGRHMSTYFGLVDFLTGIQLLLIMVIGSYRCLQGDTTVGSMLAVISYMAMLQQPIRGLGRVLMEMSKASVSVNRLFDIMHAEREQSVLLPDENRRNDDINFRGDIAFREVSFGYQPEKDVLQDISCTFAGGSTVGILGGTGSGKTTLMELLCRMQELPAGKGSITIDGVDIRSIPLEILRRNIGYILQEPFLFSNTIYQNLTITSPDIPQEAVDAAVEQAGMTGVVQSFHQGYDTFVGERGVTLSGGQKQRMAIARTLLEQPAILIFDDSLSAVDAQTDARIRANLKQQMQEGNTVIIISHRIQSIMDADQILVLEQGRISQRGTHKELTEQPGLYRTIYGIQTGEVDVRGETE